MSECRVVDLKELGVNKEVFDKIYSIGEQDGRADMIEEVEDKASWIQEGLSGYYKITSEAMEQLREHKDE